MEGVDVSGVGAFEGFGEFGASGVVASAGAVNEDGGGEETRGQNLDGSGRSVG